MQFLILLISSSVCPEHDIVPPFVDVPAGPEILPLPLAFIPEVKIVTEAPVVPHSEYGVPEVPTERIILPEVPHSETVIEGEQIVVL